MLSVKQLTLHFEKIAALDQVSFDLEKGSITGLIGQNGAGKSTLLNCISRIIQPTSGEIYFEDKSLLKKPPHALMKLGIARTFQQTALFEKMTVLDNILTGLHSKTRSGFTTSALRLPKMQHEENESIVQAKTLLAEHGLEKLEKSLGADLPIFIQKRVELLRALISRPQLLLLDEPASGLTLSDKQSLKSWLCHLRDQYQITILMVEHNMDMVMQMSDRVIVLDFGRKIADGTPDQVQHASSVIQAYLGKT